MESNPEHARAFGEGSDARLRGLGMAACPYPPSHTCREFWILGYRHIAAWWGIEAKWPIRALPEVHKQAG